ncbi:thioredoxin family protein [Oscillochloris sp. ZM17-4]|uniref:TlpA family protein disulfide reductase n=1 Tax=Oscillochloris sp. ZM17-4 TaxID=2866714 RepID=UPI001C735672|nr:thioredoxin family protein [Oscillochloris sp. ZM17-4]MBX0329638.1 thioredoxin family protein [Oscillochloris sp. ZM17-4]
MTTARTLRPGALPLLALLLLVALAACGQPAQSGPSGASGTSGASGSSSTLVPVLAVSELDVGPNRIALGLLQDGTPLNKADLRLSMRFFYLDGSEDTKVQSESTAVYRGQGLPFGLYVGYATFDKPGNWSVEISIPNGGTPQVVNLRLDVKEKSRIPAIGEAALPSKNLTVRDNADLTKISSDTSPDPDFYQLTIADAIAAKKPFVIGFLTPGYCQTAVCGPNLAVLKKLKDQFKGKVNFIHVEVYPYPYGESFQQQKRVQPMVEWGLITEPWTFLVDADGIIQYRYEGGITFDEMEPAMAQLAAGEPVTPLVSP